MPKINVMVTCKNCGNEYGYQQGDPTRCHYCDGFKAEYLGRDLITWWEEPEPTIRFVINDGGRADAGINEKATGDCVTRAIAIATQTPYKEVRDDLNEIAKRERPRGRTKRSNARTGVHKYTYNKYLASIGWEWVPTMGIGSGCKVHLRADELPKGRIIVRLSRHLAAVIDGVLHDTHDCSRCGTRCVYGYWIEPKDNEN